MRCCVRISMPRKNNAIPRDGCWRGWSMSMTQPGCRIRRCATTSGKRRPQIAAEAGRALEAGFVPQTYRPALKPRSTSTICG